MVAAFAAFDLSVNLNWVHGGRGGCASLDQTYKFSVRMPFLTKERCNFNNSRKCIIRSPYSSLSSPHPIVSSHTSEVGSHSIVNESTLILIRHGESMWNEKNLFTGCVDVPLTNKGVEEAIEAGKRIKNLPLDVIYISALIRSQMTAMLALTEHHCMKVLLHINPNSQIHKYCFIFRLGSKHMKCTKCLQLYMRNEMQGMVQCLCSKYTYRVKYI
ncbi:uncharacterized protein LOC116007989 [Ipomoea triloba]|uniref:uncharacterized protein LOC116007989 n=1 Tax=Ipomoea triloba TaxID=35885 RepID=UPI00125D9FB2|nr:uncharacterized protein LOC116007989 [Ipomoea triloba]